MKHFDKTWFQVEKDQFASYGFPYTSVKGSSSGGINEVNCMRTFDCMWGWKMIAYESKINIFAEMRYFLMFYLNLGFIVLLASVLLILSNFSFLSIGHSFSRTFILLFWQECMSTLFEVYTRFICNQTQINDRE